MKRSKRLVLEMAVLLALSGILGFGTQVGVIKRYLRGEFKQGFLSPETYQGIRLITHQEAEDLFAQDGTVFIDSRPRSQYKNGHVLGAKNIPLEEVEGVEKDTPSPFSKLAKLFKRPRAAKTGTPARRMGDSGREAADVFAPLSLFPRETPLVVYCEGGDCRTSLALAKVLHERGFEDVRVYQDGWEGWTRSGLPTELGDK